VDDRLDLPQGTLDLLILKALSLEPQHGWAISERIQQVSRAALQIPQGSLYPALHRLEKQGWVRAEWRQTEANQRAKFYSLTAAGKKQLIDEHARWKQMVQAIGHIMETAPAKGES
jgi:transcriptional regulator